VSNQTHPQYPRSSNVIKINRKQKNKHGLGFISSFNKNTPTVTGTFETKINISTPTQRYVGSPEQQLFVGGQSITEFIPLNLQQQPEDNHNEPDLTSTIQTDNKNDDDNDDNDNPVTPQTPVTDQKDLLQFSHTADSALTDSTSNNMKPANKTGAIPVIKQYTKPSKISRF